MATALEILNHYDPDVVLGYQNITMKKTIYGYSTEVAELFSDIYQSLTMTCLLTNKAGVLASHLVNGKLFILSNVFVPKLKHLRNYNNSKMFTSLFTNVNNKMVETGMRTIVIPYPGRLYCGMSPDEFEQCARSAFNPEIQLYVHRNNPMNNLTEQTNESLARTD